MAELITYDPSNDPQALAEAEARDAESLAKHQEYEEQRQSPYANKFDSPEQLEQAYLELQKKLGEGSNEQGDEGEEEEVSEESEETTDEYETSVDDEILEVFDLLDDEYNETGTLSQESMDALAELPPGELVQAYLQYNKNLEQFDGGRELSDAEVEAVYKQAGGEQQYNEMVNWAAQNFSPEEVQAFDNVIESGDPATINLALRALSSSYNDAMGMDGSMLQGKPSAARSVYRSQAELVRDMSDPRYDRDPAYREEIAQKLARSGELM